MRDLALFNMVLDSKLQGRDLVKLEVSDIACSSVDLIQLQCTGDYVSNFLGDGNIASLGLI